MLGDGKHAEPAKAGSSWLEVGLFLTPKAVVDTGTTFFTAEPDTVVKINGGNGEGFAPWPSTFIMRAR